MESDKDSFGILRLLESTHGFKSRIEVTDIRFKSVRGGGNASVDEVREGVAAGFLETHQDVVMNGAESEDICLNQSFQMLPAQEKSLWGRMQEKLAVTEQNPLLRVARMSAESFELQSRLQVPEQMDMAALHVDAVGLQNLCQAWQTVDRCRCENDPAFQNSLEQIVEGLRGFFTGAQTTCKQSRLRVPDQVFAVLLAANRESFAVEDEDTARHVRICKDSTREIAVQGTHDRCVLVYIL